MVRSAFVADAGALEAIPTNSCGPTTCDVESALWDDPDWLREGDARVACAVPALPRVIVLLV